jgi:hypothetical protein
MPKSKDCKQLIFKRALLLLLAIIVATVLIGCGSAKTQVEEAPVEEVPPTYSMQISGKTEINVGERTTLSVKADFDFNEAEVVWTSSDPSIATVEAGEVTAIAPGQTDIVASYPDPNASVTLTITVPDPEVQKAEAEAKKKEEEKKAAEQAAQAKINAATTIGHTFDVTYTDKNGYKMKATIKMGDWIKGSETAMLQKAWTNAGGKDSMPLTEGTYYAIDGYGLKWTMIDSSAAAYVFGSVSFTYITTNYPITSFSGGSFELSASVEGIDATCKLGYVLSATQYSSTIESDTGSGGRIAKPHLSEFTSNRWGPVPFAIAIDNVFNPNYPNGDPDLDTIKLSFDTGGSTEREPDELFSIGKTW